MQEILNDITNDITRACAGKKPRKGAGRIARPRFANNTPYVGIDGELIHNSRYHKRTNSLAVILKSKGITEAFKVDVE